MTEPKVQQMTELKVQMAELKAQQKLQIRNPVTQRMGLINGNQADSLCWWQRNG